MREIVTTCAEVIGLSLVSVGAGIVFLPAGLIVGGLSLVLVGYAAGRR